MEAQITALTCALPAELGVPLTRWSATELAKEAVTRHIVTSASEAPSATSVSRWLRADPIKPW